MKRMIDLAALVVYRSVDRYSMMPHHFITAQCSQYLTHSDASVPFFFQNTIIMNTPTAKVRFEIAEPETPASNATAAASRSPAPFLPVVKTLDCFAVPQKKDYRHSTGLVHCVVRREAGKGRFGFASNRITFSLQKRDGTEIVLLVAAKQAGTYTISDLSSKIGQQLGVLSASNRNNSVKSLVYALYQENEQVATILYHVPSIISVVLDGPPRSAQIAISSQQAHVQEKSPGILEAKSKISIQKTRSLLGIDDDQPFLHVFENKDPYSKGGGRWGLNFHGRGRLASSKNMQMEHKEADETVVFQIAKWDKHAFNVDFRAPFNMFQAFGFALAQIDL